MANTTIEELKKLRATSRKIADTIAHYTDLFNQDGKIDAKEQAALDKLNAAVKQIEAKIDEKEDTLGFGHKIVNKSAEVTEGIADFFSKKDDIVDHSLVKEDAPTTDTPATDDTPATADTPATDTPVVTDTPATDDTTPVVVTPPTTKTISKDVGKGCPNVEADVMVVQGLLNNHGNNITVDGDCGNKSIAAIEKFQRANMNGFSDGIISVGGKTWKLLTGEVKPSNGLPAGPVNKPNWIKIAEGELGVKENTSKTKHDPRVMEYHATTGITNNDETPWCSSFVNWVMKKAGKGGTDSAAAVSWKRYGNDVGKPAYGAIAVIDWDGPGPGWKGHVGFIVGKKGNNVLILGGNQSNAVNVKSFGTSKIVAYVFPTGYEVPDNAYTFGESDGDFGGMDLGSTR